MLELRDYQLDVVNKTWDWIRKSTESCVLELTTSAGKSFILAELAHRIHKTSNKRVLVLAPSAEIVKQNREKYLLTGEPASMFSASAGEKSTKHPVIFGSPLTVKNNLDNIKNDVAAVFLDEAHIMGATVRDIIDKIRLVNPNLRVVGCTGTPYRTGKGYIYRYDSEGNAVPDDEAIEPYFFKLICSIKARELIDKGFLCPPTTDETTIDTSYDTSQLELSKRTGLFSANSVIEAFDNSKKKTEIIINEIVNKTINNHCVMIFASTVDHANDICKSLPPGEFSMVTGKTKRKERELTIEKARSGRLKYIVSIGALTTGVDIPRVDCVAILRATESPSLLFQIIGRGMRLSPETNKTDFLLLDYANNIERHCPDGDIFDPEIKAGPPKGSSQNIEVSCPDCSFTNEFTPRFSEDGFEVDQEGYFIDLEGNRVITDGDKEFPGHFGRRCFGYSLEFGQAVRCDYRWAYKECEECGHKNDIAARKCEECKERIIDPNEKLVLEYRKIKKDPYTISTDKVITWKYQSWVSVSGKVTLKVDYTTECRSFSVWHMPERDREWSIFTKATMVPLTPTVKDYVTRSPKPVMPKTITVHKEKANGFYRVYDYDRIEEVPEL